MNYMCEDARCPNEGTERAPDGSRWCEDHFKRLETPQVIALHLAECLRESEDVPLSPLMDDDTGEGRVWHEGRSVFIDTGRNVFRLDVVKARRGGA